MAAVASLSGLKVSVTHCSLSQSCALRNNRLMPSGNLRFNSTCILPSLRSRALAVARAASSVEAETPKRSESEQVIWQEKKERAARQVSLHEAENNLRFLEAQLRVSVPVGVVTATGCFLRYLLAGIPSIQNPHADYWFLIVLFFAGLYMRPFFQYPGAKQKWSRLNKAVEDDLQRAAKELN